MLSLAAAYADAFASLAYFDAVYSLMLLLYVCQRYYMLRHAARRFRFAAFAAAF